MKYFSILFCITILTGCAAQNIKDQDNYSHICYDQHGQSMACGGRPTMENITLSSLEKHFSHEPWAKTTRGPIKRPKIGIAASGGGNKAAPFGLGVYKRLVDEGWIKNVDILSSVSGGGYANTYLFSRAAYAQAVCEGKEQDCFDNTLEALFKDYRVFPMYVNGGESFCTGQHGCIAVPSLDLANDIDDPKIFSDIIVRKQNLNVLPKCYQIGDGIIPRIAGSDASVQELKFITDFLKSRDSHEYRSLVWTTCFADLLNPEISSIATDGTENFFIDKPREYAWALPTFVIGSPVTLPVKATTNWLFDLPINSSLSYQYQRSGLKRSYGFVPHDWINQRDLKFLDTLRDYEATRTSVFHNKKLNLFEVTKDKPTQEFKFKDLKNLMQITEGIDQAKLPLWIMNSVTPTSGMLDFGSFDFSEMDEYRFEISPYGFGSRSHGFVKTSEQDDTIQKRLGVSILDGQTASQAFAYPRQRIFGPLKNIGSQTFMETVNFDWSVSIPNYRMTKNQRYLSSTLPFPAHLITRFNEKDMRPIIPLGDGGVNRDVWGLLPLLERGVETIIALDQSSDRGSDELLKQGRGNRAVNMQNLCEFSKFLKSKKMTILLEWEDVNNLINMNGLNQKGIPYCTDDAVGPNAFETIKADPTNWPGKIINAYIIKNSLTDEIAKKAHNQRDNWCIGEDINNVQISCTNLKIIKSAIQLSEITNINADDLRRNDLKNTCWQKLKTSPAERQKLYENDNPIPPTLCAFVELNYRAGFNIFPQHGVEALTANSSKNLMHAYIDLGWYNAGGLKKLFSKFDMAK